MRFIFIVAITLCMSCHKAYADDLFQLTGNNTSISFTLPEAPTISSLLPFSGGFALDNVLITVAGKSAAGHLNFLNGPKQGGGVDAYVGNKLEASTRGHQLFTGSDTAPIFVPGDFVVDQELSAAYNPNLISITAVSPEPSGLTLLGTGLLGIAGILRKRFF